MFCKVIHFLIQFVESVVTAICMGLDIVLAASLVILRVVFQQLKTFFLFKKALVLKSQLVLVVQYILENPIK